MLSTVFVILLMLWLVGLMTGHTMGGVIHILPVIAIVVVLVRFIQGRRRLKIFRSLPDGGMRNLEKEP
jgi:hypothetical protein